MKDYRFKELDSKMFEDFVVCNKCLAVVQRTDKDLHWIRHAIVAQAIKEAKAHTLDSRPGQFVVED